MRRSWVALLLLAATASVSRAETRVIELTVKAGQHACTNTPVTVPLSLPPALARATAAGISGDLKAVGQLTGPSLTTEHLKPSAANLVRRDLHFIVPKLKAGATAHLRCTIDSEAGSSKGPHFAWKDVEGKYSELSWQEDGSSRPVLRYMKETYDASTPEKRNRSYKVFHHLYDPEGQRYVTNGGHTDPYKNAKELLYPHHRGLMYGFNRVTYDGNKKADTWHCTGDDYVAHVDTLREEAGPVLGRHRVLLAWHGSPQDVFAQEERELTVYSVPGGTLVEFASLLKTTNGTVKLDGDPQHAGFQFRAANQVAKKSQKQTYYIRPGSGKGKLGQTINWPQTKDGTVDLPWKGLSFVLDDQRYSVAYLDHPSNPGEARHSEREYGRFGYYFEYTLTKDNPLLVNYRIWLQEGEMTAQQIEQLYQEFVAPPAVTVKK